MLTLDLTSAQSFLSNSWLDGRLSALGGAQAQLLQGNGAGGEFTGWVNLPVAYDKEEFARIQAAAQKIRTQANILVVIGIGGSYLGARAALELLGSADPRMNQDKMEVFFAGNTLSSDALCELLGYLDGKDFCVNVISKSGTTTEPAVAFRIFKNLLESKYGKEGAKERIYATTDKARGALKGLATTEGYETFVVPDDVGGRFSVLTAVGLLPIAAAGYDIEALMAGAAAMQAQVAQGGEENIAWQYAAARNDLLAQGKNIEILGCYEPSFRFFAEWWKQLYGESEGKNGKGIFPASVEFTADLHSMGQYIQDGQRMLMETIVKFEKPRHAVVEIPTDPANVDGLNFLAGQGMDFVNEMATVGTRLAHVDGGVPNMVLTATTRDEKTLGEMIYFFEFACGLSGYLLEVNPFDQPGVEAYKNNMYALLGKPGYEAQKAQLEARLQG